MRRSKSIPSWRPGLAAAAGVVLVFAAAGVLAPSVATPALGDEVNHQLRAEQLRKQSQARAAGNLGYPTVIDLDDSAVRTTDYYAISQAIRRLGALLEDMARREETAGAAGMPGGPGILAPVPQVGLAAYGPDGPTEESVRLLLRYRLMVQGNPRLTIGQVEDAGDAVRASVVTRDGSLVEEYRIDKATGAWRPVRD